MRRCLFYTALLVGLSACAPVMLGRTPRPAPVGEVRVSSLGSYPLLLTTLPAPTPELTNIADVFTGPFKPYLTFAPMPSAGDLTLAYGLVPGTEISGTFSLVPDLGLRVGGKTLLTDAVVRLAADYGAFVYGSSAGTDLGLLGSVPTRAAEFYAGVRDFGRVPFLPLVSPTLAGALTVGAAVPWSAEPDAGRTLFELTLLASGFSGAVETLSVQPVGFSLVPAVGFTF